MKRATTLVIAAASLAVLLPDAAPAATRYVRSSKRSGEETGIGIPNTRGNVRTVRHSTGNVRRSTGTVRRSAPVTTRTSTTTTNKTRTRDRGIGIAGTRRTTTTRTSDSTPRSRTRTDLTTTRRSSTYTTNKTRTRDRGIGIAGTRRTTTTRSSSSTPRIRTRTDLTTTRRSSTYTTRRRSDGDTFTFTPSRTVSRRTTGNVRRGGNVDDHRDRADDRRDRSYRDGSRRDRSHDRDGDSGRSRRHRYRDYRREHERHRSSHRWASAFAFTYRRGGTCLSIHSGPGAPYWYNGTWHARPTGYRYGCVLYYGYWIDTRDVYYVERREPPWVSQDYWDEFAAEDDEGVLVYDGDFIRKEQVVDTVLVKELPLSSAERSRADVLIAGGILQQILDEGDPEGNFDYDFDPRASRLTLTAPSERIAVIETLVRDRSTFDAVTEPDRHGNTAAVVPLVSPLYLEDDYSGAVRLAQENFTAMRRMLEDRDPRYAAHGKRTWLNAEFGTATVVDEADNLERAFTFMETRPFVPRELVRR